MLVRLVALLSIGIAAGCSFGDEIEPLTCSPVADADGDGCNVGRPGLEFSLDQDETDCPEGFSTWVCGDCDDTDSAVHMSATEECTNDVDDDCDGRTDLEDGDCEVGDDDSAE
jgi:hypothetical protein